ncbi:MAG: DUF4268 domain-containing protein [Cyclobacteriaceae bacterium]|nr:DUF4268 domain-containing protein [Cyclobacteriaceae bacterium SS2]
MYRINKSSNNVERLDERLFKDLKIKERDHLQEWIAKNPDMLGEDLMIIQKEFNGFNDTQERLDLLAIDKQGGLVIIENKLDDTGRNVVWQALKYTSYCSTLTSSQIISIYQSYLDNHAISEDAKENLMEFLDCDEESLLLNTNDQRIIFVANHFRKEVTSTVMWLLNHDIQIQCFRATPYSMGEETFLQIEQIIPLPETKEFMIDAKEKEKEEKGKSKIAVEREASLVEFWTRLKKELKNQNQNYLDNVNPKPFYNIGFWKGQGFFAYCIGRDTLRVELYFQNDAEKVYFDTMLSHKDEIEESVRNQLIWERLETKKASRIKLEIEKAKLVNNKSKFMDRTDWDTRIEWYHSTMTKFYNAIYPVWEKVQSELD